MIVRRFFYSSSILYFSMIFSSNSSLKSCIGVNFLSLVKQLVGINIVMNPPSIVIKAKDTSKVNFSSYVVLIKDRLIVSNYDMLLTYINGKYRYNSRLTPYEINYIQNILNIERSK